MTTAAAAPASNNSTVKELLFGFQGRVGRLQFWLVHVASLLIAGLFWGIVNLRPPPEAGAPPPPPVAGAELLEIIPWLIMAALVWPLLAISVKRLHDRGQSGWWMLLALVPGVGQVWQLVNLGILQAKGEDNRFGPAARADSEATRDVRSTSVMFVLGFAAGLPSLLVFSTLSIWLRDEGIPLTAISIFGLVTLATAVKFLWAPLLDRTNVPFLTGRLGHRRSWMLVSQIVIILGLWLIAGSDPKTNLVAMAALAALVAFASANQDIVIDAWRIEVAEQSRQGAMAAAYQWGYRVAIVIAGVAPLVLADAFSWRFSYLVMAALMLIGMAAVLAAPREAAHKVRPIDIGDTPARPIPEVIEWVVRLTLLVAGGGLAGLALAGSGDAVVATLAAIGAPMLSESFKTAWASDAKVLIQLVSFVVGALIIVIAARRVPGVATRPGAYLSGALGQPFSDFFGRYGRIAGLILALVCLYRVSDFVININGAFYLDLGFTKAEIAEIQKVFGVVVSMLGVALGGFCVARLGLMRTMILGGFTGTLSNLGFAWLATQGHSIPALAIAISLDNIGGGIAGTCLIAYMSSLTTTGFTATQYAMFSSLYALPGKLLASQSGRIVESTARAADAGGPMASLKSLFAGIPPETYAKAIEKSSVTPQALGVGYLVFFLYSTVIGVFAIVLTFMIAARQPKPEAAGEVAGETGAKPA